LLIVLPSLLLRFFKFTGNLELAHKPPVNVVFEPKGRPKIKNELFFPEDGPAVAQIKDQEISPTRFETPHLPAIESRQQIVKQYGILPDGVDAYLVQGLGLKINAVATPEYFRIGYRL
jgi:hypothetical protein